MSKPFAVLHNEPLLTEYLVLGDTSSPDSKWQRSHEKQSGMASDKLSDVAKKRDVVDLMELWMKRLELISTIVSLVDACASAATD